MSTGLDLVSSTKDCTIIWKPSSSSNGSFLERGGVTGMASSCCCNLANSACIANGLLVDSTFAPGSILARLTRGATTGEAGGGSADPADDEEAGGRSGERSIGTTAIFLGWNLKDERRGAGGGGDTIARDDDDDAAAEEAVVGGIRNFDRTVAPAPAFGTGIK